MIKSVLTIAGSDCSGGAGIQADIKTIAMHGQYAMSVITALTAQNTTGVQSVLDVPQDFVSQQLNCVMIDIRPDAVKIGMVSSPSIVEAIADGLTAHGAGNIVLDPVMVSTSGSRLISPEAVDALRRRLLPMATVITPNLPEAEVLSGLTIRSREEMVRAAQRIAGDIPGGVLIKGGHCLGDASDLLYWQGEALFIEGPRIDNPNTHGTGCTLSSAIACNLAAGYALPDSVRRAKDYLTDALRAGLNLGKGPGPLWHNYALSGARQAP